MQEPRGCTDALCVRRIICKSTAAEERTSLIPEPLQELLNDREQQELNERLQVEGQAALSREERRKRQRSLESIGAPSFQHILKVRLMLFCLLCKLVNPELTPSVSLRKYCEEADMLVRSACSQQPARLPPTVPMKVLHACLLVKHALRAGAQCAAAETRPSDHAAAEHRPVLQPGLLALPCGELSPQKRNDGQENGRALHCPPEGQPRQS